MKVKLVYGDTFRYGPDDDFEEDCRDWTPVYFESRGSKAFIMNAVMEDNGHMEHLRKLVSSIERSKGRVACWSSPVEDLDGFLQWKKDKGYFFERGDAYICNNADYRYYDFGGTINGISFHYRIYDEELAKELIETIPSIKVTELKGSSYSVIRDC